MAQVKDVLVIEEDGDKTYWRNVGVAFVNKDGSLNVKLYMFPGLKLQIRERKEKEQG
jgi:hypothetical protein